MPIATEPGFIRAIKHMRGGVDVVCEVDPTTFRHFVDLGAGTREPLDDIWPSGRWFELPSNHLQGFRRHERRVFIEGVNADRLPLSIWIPASVVMQPATLFFNQQCLDFPRLFQNGWAYCELGIEPELADLMRGNEAYLFASWAAVLKDHLATDDDFKTWRDEVIYDWRMESWK